MHNYTMTGFLLDLLANEAYVSGEDLATKMGMTRSAVWKQVKGLRKLGYKIEAHPSKGYLLVEKPDRIYPWEVMGKLETEFIGRKMEYYDELPSTNQRAKELILTSPPEGTLILAEKQTSGKGRLGRAWFSPAGIGLCFSLILKPQLPPNELPKLTLVAAVALSKAIYQEAHRRPLVKWPNDLYLEGRKVSGILTELSGEMGRLEYLILGVGININQESVDFPEEIREKAGSLRSILGQKKPFSRLDLLGKYLKQLEEEYTNAIRSGFERTLTYCRRHSATLGNRVEVTDGRRVYQGKAIRIEDHGGLVVEDEEGKQAQVISGDVNLIDFPPPEH